jgi:hypothetical protein
MSYMRSLKFAAQIPMLAAAVAAVALVACASPAAPTTLTAADISTPSAREAAKDATPGAAAEGQLVCRTKSSAEGTTELFLEWKGTEAKGSLRRTAPSGNVTTQNVHAERYKGMIIADDTSATDLVIHAATVADHNGKQHIRLGDWKSGWAACE